MLTSEFHISSNKNLKCSEKLKVGLGNMQLIKNKQLDLANHIHMVSSDIFLLIETWLNDDFDSNWKVGSELNLNGLHLNTVDQANEKKGGIAIVYKDNIKKKKINTSQFNYFNSGVWRLDINNCSILVMIIF